MQWDITPREASVGFLWSWLENQKMAALKAVPPGQTDDQSILFALARSRHETRYSILFCSRGRSHA